jgi:hypothetical protein
MNDDESLRYLVVRLFGLFVDVYDKLTDLQLKINQLEHRADNLPLGYSRLQIAELMTEYFDVPELNSIAWDMNIEEDEITGITRGERVRALISYCEKRQKTHELIFHCMRLRPGVAWPQLPRR